MYIPLFYADKIVSQAIIDEDDSPLVAGLRWRLSNRGYAVTKCAAKYGTKTIYMHRLILPNSQEVDHINGVKTDNRRCNLRNANRQMNNANRASYKNKTGFLGVTRGYKTDKYEARIQKDGRVIYLGRFLTPQEAGHAYNKKALELYGAMAVLNFIAN